MIPEEMETKTRVYSKMSDEIVFEESAGGLLEWGDEEIYYLASKTSTEDKWLASLYIKSQYCGVVETDMSLDALSDKCKAHAAVLVQSLSSMVDAVEKE